MSVSALAGILRRLRRDLAEKATFRTGTVVEAIDATHVLVDIGKPVPAFVSPIFLPAVVVGAPVMVRLQGSHYDVVDAPQSPATLIPTATLAALVALLPVAGGNLIPNPLPAWSVAEWTAYGWPQPPASHFGWSTDPAESDAQWSYQVLQEYGPTDISVYSLALEMVDPLEVSSFRVYPLKATAPDPGYSVPVSALASYVLSVHVAADNFTVETDTVAVGVVWMDDSLTEISTDTQTPVALNAVLESWTSTEQVEVDPWTGPASWFEAAVNPTESFTAPTGATRARPFVEFGISAGWAYNVAAWDFHRA